MQYFHLKDRSPDSLARPIVRLLYGAALLLASMLLTGCSDEKITKMTYSIPKPVLDDLDQKVSARARAAKDEAAKNAALKEQRMLAAFVPDMKNKKFWTAKLVGEPDAAAKVADDFTSFIKSWSFSDQAGELPKWTLPKDWDAQSFNDGAGAIAKVYLQVDDVPLVVTVSNFTLQGDTVEMAVQNINRWRVQQLSLRPLTAATLEKDTTVVELDGVKAYVVNEVGKFMGRMPLSTRPPTAKPDVTEKVTPPMSKKSDDSNADAKDSKSSKSTTEESKPGSKSETKSDADVNSKKDEPAKNAPGQKSEKKS